jgi:hypothetical protein
MQISRVFPLAGGLVLGLLAGCQNAGSNLGFNASQAGGVFVGVYLDRDGSRTQSATLDTVFAHARVALLARGTTDTIRIVTTDSKGVAQFDGVPVGEYRVAIDPVSIGDSIQVAAIDPPDVTLVAGGTDPIVIVRLGYPEVSIRQARALAPGKRAFIRAIILVGVQAFRDQSSHVSDSSGQIRLTQVELRGGLVGNNPGDSVTVLGTASSQNGQPTLDRAIVSRFATRPPPIPLPVSAATAATANGGLLDAGLVQVISATISDSATVAPDFQVTASDGSGPLKVILDANIPFSRGNFRPGRSMNVTGVLVPNGTGGWYLKPRAVSDVVFNN